MLGLRLKTAAVVAQLVLEHGAVLYYLRGREQVGVVVQNFHCRRGEQSGRVAYT